MKKKILYIVAIALLFAAPVAFAHNYETDKTCQLDWLLKPIIPLWICFNPDMGMDHSYLDYETMDAHYSPYMEQTVISPGRTYLYVAGGHTIIV